MDMTPLQQFIDESQKVCEAATEGPWVTTKPPKDADGWPAGVVIAAVARGQCVYANPPGGVSVESDRQFIAHARTALPTALQHLRELSQQNEALTRRVAELEGQVRCGWGGGPKP